MPKFRISAFLILLCATCIANADAKRDFAAHPAIVEIDTPNDVFAIGDVHSDYHALTKALAGAKLIDHADTDPEKLAWTGGENVLVCTGDILDKGDDAIDCIRALRHLQQVGHVVVTMGNHEAEFLAGKRKKPSKKAVDKLATAKGFAAELAKANISIDSVRAGEDAIGLGAFLRDLPIGARVNDSFFSHAGNTHGMSIPTLQVAIVQEVSRDGFGAPILQDPGSILQARMHPATWWDAEGGDPILKRNLTALGVKRIVFGHQPGDVKFADGTERKADEMFADPAGRFVMIDIGMSQGVDGTPPALLRIHRNATGESELSEVRADGTSLPFQKH
jgi:hypothetical protein